jgi:hypothetical protein
MQKGYFATHMHAAIVVTDTILCLNETLSMTGTFSGHVGFGPQFC